MSAGNRPRVQSVARAAGILLAIAQSPTGLTSREISERVGLSRQTTYHLLHTLMSVGLLTRNDGRRYLMGIRVGTLAEAFKHHLGPPEYLAPFVRQIARETGETAYAAGWWHGEVANLSMARGQNAVQAAEVPHGMTGAAHARASGKLLLAFAIEAMRADYLSRHPLVARTANTITDADALATEFERIRKQGFAVDREEFAEGLCCLAVPLDLGMSPFVFGLSAPCGRFDDNFARYLGIMRSAAAGVSAVQLDTEEEASSVTI